MVPEMVSFTSLLEWQKLRRVWSRLFLLLCISVPLHQAQATDENELFIESAQFQSMAQQFILDNFFLERSIVNPAGQQVHLHYYQPYGARTWLQKVDVKIDDIAVFHHEYQGRDVERLYQGAYQPMTTLYLPPGKHRITFRAYGLGLSTEFIEGSEFFDKGVRPTNIRLRIESKAVRFEIWE